jgi:hypothetical protein
MPLYENTFKSKIFSKQYDIIFAGAVLHHLRGGDDWQQVFSKIYDLTAPGGSVWITDLVGISTITLLGDVDHDIEVFTHSTLLDCIWCSYQLFIVKR